MSGHAENVKWLIRLNYIVLFGMAVLIAICFDSNLKYVNASHAEIEGLIAYNKMERKQFATENTKTLKEYVKSDEIMPSAFKGKLRKQ